MRRPWLVLLAVVATAATVHAQPDVRDHRADHRPPPPPPPAAAGPTEAPPAPREEKIEARAGYVWIAGRWEWKNKWEWVAGHWERARAGKHWRAGRWDKKDNHWSYVEGDWEAGGEPTPPAAPPTPPPPGTGPTGAPPPPRAENHDAKRGGYVWVEGAWDWKDNKWDWVAGHWERERAGKRWRPLRWEQRDGRWQRTDGDWEDANATPPPPPPPGNPGIPPLEPPPQHHHDWKLERPTVSSYWPAKGKAGTRVVIRGKNFPADAELSFANAPVKAAKVTPDQIVFEIPAGAASGTIAMRAGHGRAVVVGDFEVAAAFDPIAEQKRIEEEQRKAAEAAWATRQSALAKDRAARQVAIDQRRQERAANREQRRADEIAQIQAKWDRAFLADQDTQDELTMHAQRVAELGRMGEMAELSANTKLGVRIQVLQQREDDRHAQRMAALHTSFGAKGGQP